MKAEVSITNKRTQGLFLLAIPIWLIELLLLPLLVLLLPLLLPVCLVAWINPFRAMGLFLLTLGALKGTQIEMEDCHRSVLIHVA